MLPHYMLPHTDKPIRWTPLDENNDNALYDKTLSRSSGAGLLFNQTIRRMSHEDMSLRGSSDTVISSVLCRRRL